MKNQWLDTQAYPFQSHYFTINGQALHYIDEGQGETLLFVHGTPSWSFDFREIIKILRPHYRCVAIDHIGFGLSDKPAVYDYSTLQHSHTLEQFVLAKNLNNINLIVHDFGGPIGLHMAIRQPDRIKRLTIMNSWLWSSQDDPDYKKLRRILRSPLLPFLYRYLNFSPRYILPQSFGDKPLSKQLLSQYTRPFANPSERNGALAFAKSLLHDQDWFQSLWEQRSLINSKPCLFIWGMKDPVIKPHYLEKFNSGFTNSKVHRIEGCGHFPQEEQPELVANYLLDFLKGNG